jgi:hypothetical protein
MPVEPEANVPIQDEEEEMEIVVEVTDDQQVALTAGEWSVVLSVEEARLLGEALMDAADDAENGVE